MSDIDGAGEKAEQPRSKPLPIWAKIGRIVAVVGAVGLFVIAYLMWRGDPSDEASLERIGGWIFNAMLVGAVLLFVGRYQSRR